METERRLKLQDETSQFSKLSSTINARTKADACRTGNIMFSGFFYMDAESDLYLELAL